MKIAPWSRARARNGFTLSVNFFPVSLLKYPVYCTLEIKRIYVSIQQAFAIRRDIIKKKDIIILLCIIARKGV